MQKFHRASGLAVVLFLALVATLALQRQTLSKTLSTALLPISEKAPVEAPDPVPVDTEIEVGPFIAPADEQKYGTSFAGRVGIDVEQLEPLPPARLKAIDAETLWLARCIFSETKQAREQELIAWVVRNRVESGYRGKRTYQSVVLDPMQFSAFNPGTPTRAFYSALTPQSKYHGWQRALRIALEVRHASPLQRPFSVETRHFYSEQSMVGRKHPVWAQGLEPVVPKREFALDARRFRFLADVS